MTPEQKLIRIVEGAIGDDLERARAAFRQMSGAQLDQQYGQSGKTRREILKAYEDERALYLKAKALLMEKLGATP